MGTKVKFLEDVKIFKEKVIAFAVKIESALRGDDAKCKIDKYIDLTGKERISLKIKLNETLFNELLSLFNEGSKIHSIAVKNGLRVNSQVQFNYEDFHLVVLNIFEDSCTANCAVQLSYLPVSSLIKQLRAEVSQSQSAYSKAVEAEETEIL